MNMCKGSLVSCRPVGIAGITLTLLLERIPECTAMHDVVFRGSLRGRHHALLRDNFRYVPRVGGQQARSS